MFKEIEANFCIDSKEQNTAYFFKVMRAESGCFDYGDRSQHIINSLKPGEKKGEIIEEFYKSFDTRYGQIPTEKEKWIGYWEDYFKKGWPSAAIFVYGYQEKNIRTKFDPAEECKEIYNFDYDIQPWETWTKFELKDGTKYKGTVDLQHYEPWGDDVKWLFTGDAIRQILNCKYGYQISYRPILNEKELNASSIKLNKLKDDIRSK